MFWWIRMPKNRVCIVSLAAYPLLAGKGLDTKIVGGAELQCVLLARELAKRDFDVSFVVLDHGQKSPEMLDGIRVVKSYPANAKMGIRITTVRRVCKALGESNADIYYGFRGIAGIVALYCLLRRKRLVIGIPSDMEVEGERASRISVYNCLWRFDLKVASRVISQTKYQQQMLKRRFGRDSVIIKAFHSVDMKLIEKSAPPIVLWVSTIRPKWKQPELFLKLAYAIPEARFQMIGGPSEDKKFYEGIRDQANRIPNLDFVGFVPHHEVDKYFEKASIFVNTSDVEGFPNTFLEAWSRYTPVVSLNIDPDEIICENRLGFHSKSLEQMINDVKLLLADDKLRREMGERGRHYVEHEHDIKNAVKQYVELFIQVIGMDL
jgi:glycosyltransferase involved in cell wall biosynthesis